MVEGTSTLMVGAGGLKQSGNTGQVFPMKSSAPRLHPAKDQKQTSPRGNSGSYTTNSKYEQTPNETYYLSSHSEIVGDTPHRNQLMRFEDS